MSGNRNALLSVLAFVLGSSLCAAVADDNVVLRISPDDPNEISGSIFSVAFSPDGQTVAASYGMFAGLLQEPQPGQAILWDARTGGRKKTFSGYIDGVSSVAFSRDGALVAAVGWMGDIKLWDVATGELRREIRAPGVAEGVGFSPDGKLLAAGLWVGEGNLLHGRGAVQTWNVTTGEVVHCFEGHTNAVRTISFSPDGKFIASGSMDGTARLWDVAEGKLRAVLTCPEVVQLSKTLSQAAAKAKGFEYEPRPLVESLAFSPDGSTLAIVFGEFVILGKRDGVGMVKLWDVATGNTLATFSGHKGFITDVAYSPDGTLLATAGKDGVIKLWKADDRSEVTVLNGSGPIAFSPDGNRMAIRTGPSTLTLLDIPH